MKRFETTIEGHFVQGNAWRILSEPTLLGYFEDTDRTKALTWHTDQVLRYILREGTKATTIRRGAVMVTEILDETGWMKTITTQEYDN